MKRRMLMRIVTEIKRTASAAVLRIDPEHEEVAVAAIRQSLS